MYNVLYLNNYFTTFLHKTILYTLFEPQILIKIDKLFIWYYIDVDGTLTLLENYSALEYKIEKVINLKNLYHKMVKNVKYLYTYI